jgi:hypothetical protein
MKMNKLSVLFVLVGASVFSLASAATVSVENMPKISGATVESVNFKFTISPDELPGMLCSYKSSASSENKVCSFPDTKDDHGNVVFNVSFGAKQDGSDLVLPADSSAALNIYNSQYDHLSPDVSVTYVQDGATESETVPFTWVPTTDASGGANNACSISDMSFVQGGGGSGTDLNLPGDGKYIVGLNDTTASSSCLMQVASGKNDSTVDFIHSHHPVVLNVGEDYRVQTLTAASGSASVGGNDIPLLAINTDLLTAGTGNAVLSDLEPQSEGGDGLTSADFKLSLAKNSELLATPAASYGLQLDANSAMNLVWNGSPETYTGSDLVAQDTLTITAPSNLPHGQKWAASSTYAENVPMIINADVRAYTIPEIEHHNKQAGVQLPRVNILPVQAGEDINAAINNYFGSVIPISGGAGVSGSLGTYLFDQQKAKHIIYRFHNVDEVYKSAVDDQAAQNNFDANEPYLNPLYKSTQDTSTDDAITLPSVAYLPAYGQTVASTANEHGNNAYWYNADDAGSKDQNCNSVNFSGGDSITVNSTTGNLTGTLHKPGLYELNLEILDTDTGYTAWQPLYIDVAPNGKGDFGGTQSAMASRLSGHSWLWTYSNS